LLVNYGRQRGAAGLGLFVGRSSVGLLHLFVSDNLGDSEVSPLFFNQLSDILGHSYLVGASASIR
jgi:hypothetical protein